MTTAAMPARSDEKAPVNPVLFITFQPVNGRLRAGFIKMAARRTADANRPDHLIALFHRQAARQQQEARNITHVLRASVALRRFHHFAWAFFALSAVRAFISLALTV